jgi:hypothetical protein
MKNGFGTTPMTEAEREATRRRLRIWQEAQPALEAQHWQELMALTDEQALKLTQAVLRRQGVPREVRDSSGLVEQQELFRRSRGR